MLVAQRGANSLNILLFFTVYLNWKMQTGSSNTVYLLNMAKSKTFASVEFVKLLQEVFKVTNWP